MFTTSDNCPDASFDKDDKKRERKGRFSSSIKARENLIHCWDKQSVIAF